MSDPCKVASLYAERMMSARNLTELALISKEVKANLVSLVGWEDWLRDCWRSARDTILTPDIPFEDTLNAVGRAALRKGLI
jgi:hypothetical protein